MKPFNGYEEAKKNAQRSTYEKLPAGCYVCKILGVKTDGNMIRIQWDVNEGDFKGFFQKQYKENTQEDKKYKGTATIWIPKDDGSENDARTKTTFAKWTNALEDSNKGYVWDWDESKWKNKLIGIKYGEVGKNINGNDVRFNMCRGPVSVEDVKSGKVKTPEFYAFKGFNESPAATSAPAKETDFMNIPAEIDEEIPF